MSNIEDDVEILESIVKVHNDFLQGVNKESINEKEIRALEHLLSHYKNMKFNYENLIHDISLIAESLGMQEDSTIEEIAIRISEEMYNQQQINEEHQKLNGEFREKVKKIEEQLEIANSKIQELEEENMQKDLETIGTKEYTEANMKEIIEKYYTANEDCILKQKVKQGLEDIEDYFDRLNGPDEDIEYIRHVKQEILEGESK